LGPTAKKMLYRFAREDFRSSLLPSAQRQIRHHNLYTDAKMKYVLVSGGMYSITANFKYEKTCIDEFAGVISGIGKGVIGMPLHGKKVKMWG
jgi:hypothetical protein